MAVFHPKVASTAVAGAVMAIAAAELSRRGVTLAPEEAAGLTVLVSLLVGYFTPSDSDSDNNAAVPPAQPPAPGP